jgi:hypothetical protein
MAHKKSSIHKKCFRLTPITAAVMFGALNIGAQADVLIDGAGVIGVYGQEPDSLVSTPTVLSNSADDIHIQNTLNQGAGRGSYGIRLDTASSQGGILTYSKVGASSRLTGQAFTVLWLEQWARLLFLRLAQGLIRALALLLVCTG